MDQKININSAVFQVPSYSSRSKSDGENVNRSKYLHRGITNCRSFNYLSSLTPEKVPKGGLNQRVKGYVIPVYKPEYHQITPIDYTYVRKCSNEGEFYFINDPVSKQRIIDFFSLHPLAFPTICIRSPEDLEKHGLMQQTWLRDGQFHKSEGRLFIDEPLTLIFDLTTMTPCDIAGFNDMLQANPACNSKPLGPRVKRVFLVNDGMLNGSQPANPDLWRRLELMTQKEIPAGPAEDTLTDETLLAQITTATIPDNKPVVTIDFACSGDWYHRLFGGIALNERGLLFFSEGALANLEDGTHLLIKNAPWDSTGFKETLATAIRTGRFAANRQWIRLPDKITLSSENVSATRLNNMKAQAINDSQAFNGDRPFVCINSESLESLKGNVRVQDTAVVRTDKLATLVKDCDQLVITGSLNDKQWLWLLTQLDQLPDPRPMLFADLPPSMLVRRQDGVAAQLNQSEPRNLNNSDSASFIYEVNPTDSLDSLREVNLTSQNNFTFSLTDSPLMASLVKGTPVVLSGLERNPKLAANLETLWLPNPYLFLHGYKVELPNARVTLIRPENGQTTGSLLIDHVFSQSENQTQPAENPVYSLLTSLPGSCQKRYPNKRPWRADDFPRWFERQAEAERTLDGSAMLRPCHQRRALHILLAKEYRNDAKVYSFIKAKIARYYSDQPADCRADRSALQQWLSKHPDPELEDIKTDFWLLARSCPADIHQAIERLDKIDDQAVKNLAIHVVGAADQFRQPSLAGRLNVNLSTAREQRFYDGTVRSTLRDALVASKASLKRDTSISQTVASLEDQIVPVLEKNWSDKQKTEHIKQILIPYFQPNLPANRLPEHCQDLPDALVANQRHTWSRQERRLVHLANRVQEHPIVFLQGEAGVGKTFMARAIATKAGYPACQLIQLDSNRTPEALFGGQQLVSHQTGSVTDQHTAFHEGPILQWARSEDPSLLLLDEANLAPEGLLAPLAGLTRQPPVINYRGRQYPLTDKHRIILTGNPDYYQGRHLDKTLKSQIPTFFYPPIPDTLLVTAIILPGLPGHWSAAMKQQASERLIALFKHFRELVPGELTTPRDIKDVLANVRQILSHHYLASGDLASGDLASGDLASGDLASGDLSPEQLNALIRRAFMDSLAGAVTREQQQRLTSLNLWYQGQFPEDKSVLAGADQAFATFLEQLRVKNRDADLSPAPIQQLVYRYWQSLEKDDCGRTATLVEGPAGWGKDFILDKTVQLWQKQRAQTEQPDEPFVHINANLNQWSTLEECVKKAMTRGQPIAVSELNLIPSSYLEGLFNGVLTGNAAPGFRLFATVNPGTFEGREALSPALKSRCTQVRLGALSQQDLEGMVKRIPYMRNALPRWLAGHFHQLSTALDEQKSPVQLALDDLFATAQHLAKLFSDQWFVAFQQQLSLPFRALKAPLPGLQEESARLTRQHHQEQRRLEIEGIANRVSGLAAPVTILFGKVPRCGDREITVTDNVTDQDVITAVQAMQKRGNGKPASITVDNEQAYQSENATLCLFGDILQPEHFQLTRYFPRYPYDARQYRLTFQETRLDEDGELRNYPIHWQNGPLLRLSDCLAESWRRELREDELPGKIELSLNDRWQPLPALTPFDRLRAIRVTPETDIELVRSKKTGQLLIKHQEQASVRVAIDFIIAPEQIYFYPLESGESLKIQDHLGSRRLKQLLDETVFNPDGDTCQAYKALRRINSIDKIPQRLNSLMDWLDTFSDDKNVPGQGAELLLNLLGEKQGVCRHKAMIFQILCHYWGIPARQVTNTSHTFVEISPDGGNCWRQYQLGGGGQACVDASEPDWKDYRQSVRSALQAPVERDGKSGGRSGYNALRMNTYSSLRGNITNNLKILKQQLVKGNLITKETYHQVKEDLRIYNNLPLPLTEEKDLPTAWEILLSPQFFHKFRMERQDWDEIIVKSTLDMGINRSDKIGYFRDKYYLILRMILNASPEILDTDYLNWLCDLYNLTPDYSKYYLLSLLQYLIKDCDSSQLKNRVSWIEKAYPLNPTVLEFKNSWVKSSRNQFLTVAKTIPMSRSLTDKVWQYHLHRKLHHQPMAKSILIPEKLMLGEAAFLNESTFKTCKPIIFDCTSLAYDIVDMKIYKQMEYGIKPEITASFSHKQHLYNPAKTVKTLFFHWLAEHYQGDSDGRIWLFQQYKHFSIAKLSDQIMYLTPTNIMPEYPILQLPPETIKAYFKQPSAVVLQKKELLVLLDEYLSLIAN